MKKTISEQFAAGKMREEIEWELVNEHRMRKIEEGK